MNIFLKNVLTLFSGTVVAQLIGIAFVPVLTRLFTPEEFGVFYLFASTATILTIIITGGYETTFVLPESEKDARQLLVFSLMVTLAVTIFYFLICLCIQRWSNVFFTSEHSKIILWLIPVYSCLVGLSRIFKNWSIRVKKYKWVSGANIIRSSSTSGLQTSFGLFHTGSLGLVTASCISQILPLWFLMKKNKTRWKRFTFNSLKEVYRKGKEYKNFPLLMMPGDVLNEVSIQSPVYFLKTAFSNAVVAIYSLPYKIMNQPTRFIGQAVSEVYYRHVSELNAQNKDLSEITFNTFKTLFILGILPFFVTIFWGQEIFSFVFSKEWAASGRIAAYLSPWLLFEFSGYPISNMFIIRKKLQYSFFLTLFLLIIRIAGLLVGTLIMNDLEITIILFAGSSFIYWVFIVYFCLHLSGVRLWRMALFTVSVIITAGVPLGIIKLYLK
jgi:O-antigen/teichoic acid export membrane protein